MHLRLLSWNIHKCVGGLDRRCDPARTARVIADSAPDIVLMQEVAENGSWYGGHRQVDVIGDLLGLPHRSYFVNVRFGKRRGSYGNAVLSRFPIAATENVDLTMTGRKARSVLHAELRMKLEDDRTRTLHVFNMHLGLSERERREQLARFLAANPFAGLRLSTPVVVAGDLNDVWGSLGRRFLAPAGFTGPTRPLRTFPAYAPLRALDGVYVRGDVEMVALHTVKTQRARAASDHLALLGHLRVHGS